MVQGSNFTLEIRYRTVNLYLPDSTEQHVTLRLLGSTKDTMSRILVNDLLRRYGVIDYATERCSSAGMFWVLQQATDTFLTGCRATDYIHWEGTEQQVTSNDWVQSDRLHLLRGYRAIDYIYLGGTEQPITFIVGIQSNRLYLLYGYRATDYIYCGGTEQQITFIVGVQSNRLHLLSGCRATDCIY